MRSRNKGGQVAGDKPTADTPTLPRRLPCAKGFVATPLFHPHIQPRISQSCLTDEEPDAQKGRVTCPRSHHQ